MKSFFIRLSRKSLQERIYELLEKIAPKTRSAPHQSTLKHPKKDQAKPIFLFGFARSGTTTTQHVLADVLDYNASFEPIGFNHSSWDSKKFSKIHLFLKGSPDLVTLPLFGMGGGTLSAIHTISNTEIRENVYSLIKGYVQHLLVFSSYHGIIHVIPFFVGSSRVTTNN